MYVLCAFVILNKDYLLTYLLITTPLERDRATAIGNTHKKCGEDRACSSEHMIADRETHTDRQTDRQTNTDTLIAILRCPTGGRVTTTLAFSCVREELGARTTTATT